MISSSQRPLPNNAQQSQQTDIHPPGGIRTHNLSRLTPADLRHWPRWTGYLASCTSLIPWLLSQWPWPIQAPYIPSTKSYVPFQLFRSYQSISAGPRQVFKSRNKASFYCEKLLAPRPTPKLEDHPLSTVRDCLFNIFAATLHIGGRSSIRNLRTRHAVVTGTRLSHGRLFSYQSLSRDYHTVRCNSAINVRSLTEVRAARRRWQSEWALSMNPFVLIYFPPNLSCFYLFYLSVISSFPSPHPFFPSSRASASLSFYYRYIIPSFSAPLTTLVTEYVTRFTLKNFPFCPKIVFTCSIWLSE